MSEVLETRDNLRVTLCQDPWPSNPREEYDQATHVVTVPNNRYADVDADGGPLAGAWRRLCRSHDWREAIEVFERWARIFHGAVTLEHSPHEGPSSVWYLLPEDIERHGIPDAMACLRAERDEYQAWAEGDVWGWVIEERVTWRREGGTETRETWGQVESCWGYYGYAYAEESARGEFNAYADNVQRAA